MANQAEQEETHLNDAAINVSHGHVIADHETFEVLDETTLQVTAVTCFHSRIHQALATLAADPSSHHPVSLIKVTCMIPHLAWKLNIVHIY